jgi:hypothetical protein
MKDFKSEVSKSKMLKDDLVSFLFCNLFFLLHLIFGRLQKVLILFQWCSVAVLSCCERLPLDCVFCQSCAQAVHIFDSLLKADGTSKLQEAANNLVSDTNSSCSICVLKIND